MEENWDTIADWYASQLSTGSPMHGFARDVLLAALPQDMSGARVVDLGCGEGIVTRAVAARGATVTGVDPTKRLVEHARSIERATPCGVTYAVDDGTVLTTLEDSSADWVTAGLSLNNIPDLEAAVRSVRRVLAPGGQLVFTIPHPCFEAPHASWVDTDDGMSRRLIGDYLIEGFWRSDNPSGVRRGGNQHRTVSRYLMALINHRFVIELVAEPQPDRRLIDQQPHRAGLPPFLVVRSRRV
ncbi:methyltransferase family protein [Asanoa ferruginea]|uniref:Methyltransferase family protein n=1 Tax=Asanoa ferruginea TaxID=53367 RepID=A0A3D9ZRV4_9ACTN|nr:class I SAM-dependent methyltransferase [Asanoa ferruginea]REF99202.1 methyltransferase family protein [Asanoa ferruginea]GIF45796.1 methyltransferase [Asanoa ferruginea]